MSEQKQDHRLVEVTLGKPHEHAGNQHQAGEKIRVSHAERDWLIANAIITAPTAQKEGAK